MFFYIWCVLNTFIIKFSIISGHLTVSSNTFHVYTIKTGDSKYILGGTGPWDLGTVRGLGNAFSSHLCISASQPHPALTVVLLSKFSWSLCGKNAPHPSLFTVAQTVKNVPAVQET